MHAYTATLHTPQMVARTLHEWPQKKTICFSDSMRQTVEIWRVNKYIRIRIIQFDSEHSTGSYQSTYSLIAECLQEGTKVPTFWWWIVYTLVLKYLQFDTDSSSQIYVQYLQFNCGMSTRQWCSLYTSVVQSLFKVKGKDLTTRTFRIVQPRPSTTTQHNIQCSQANLKMLSMTLRAICICRL